MAIGAAVAYFPFTPAARETVGDTLPVSGNTAPVVEPLTGETYDLVPLSWTLSAADAEGDAVLFRIVQAPAQGQASIQDGVLTYTPDEGQRGGDHLHLSGGGYRRGPGPTRRPSPSPCGAIPARPTPIWRGKSASTPPWR